MRRGAQVTLFVILGLLILLSLSFITWTTTQVAEEEQTRQEERVRQSEQAVTALKSYLQSCVEDRVQNATQRVFLQGGALYESQGGQIPSDETVSVAAHDKTWSVLPGLRRGSPCDEYTSSPPGYPAPGKGFAELADSECPKTTGPATPSFSGFLGNVTIPTLCTTEMYQHQLDNRFDESAPCTPNDRLQMLSYDEDETLAKHVSDAVSNVLRSCVDENAPRVAAGDIELTGDPNVTLRVAEENIRFNAALPTQIQVGGGSPTVKTTNFSYLADLPVVPLHRMVFDSLFRDARDPKFNLTAFLESKTQGERYDLNISERPESRIIQVRDTTATWNGDPLTFTTVVEKRPSLFDEFDRSNTPFDNVVVAGNTFTLPVRAVDPDDLKHPQISYEGFGADHHGVDPGEAAGTDRLRPEENPANTPSYDHDSSVLSPFSADTPRVDGNGYPVRPYTWGNYTTRVTTPTPSSPDDTQDINTLVIDRPALNVSITNDGFQGGPVSLEDPVTISVNESKPPEAFGQSVYNNTLRVANTTTRLGPETTLSTDPSTVQATPDSNEAIGLSKGTVNISYSALANTTYRKEIPHSVNTTVDVVACRQNPSATSPPQPYAQSTDPSTYRHPCCQPDNTPAPRTKVCYNKTYTDDLRANLNAFQTKSSQAGNPTMREVNQSEIAQANNLTVTRRCGGNRGNICAGDTSINLR